MGERGVLTEEEKDREKKIRDKGNKVIP